MTTQTRRCVHLTYIAAPAGAKPGRIWVADSSERNRQNPGDYFPLKTEEQNLGKGRLSETSANQGSREARAQRPCGREHAPERLTQDRAQDRKQGDTV